MGFSESLKSEIMISSYISTYDEEHNITIWTFPVNERLATMTILGRSLSVLIRIHRCAASRQHTIANAHNDKENCGGSAASQFDSIRNDSFDSGDSGSAVGAGEAGIIPSSGMLDIGPRCVGDLANCAQRYESQQSNGGKTNAGN
jgi:hypothetical protein